jgi:signal recognition particle GTPase
MKRKRVTQEDDGDRSPVLIESDDQEEVLDLNEEEPARSRKRQRLDIEQEKTIKKKRKVQPRSTAQQQKFQDDLLLSESTEKPDTKDNKKITDNLFKALKVTNAQTEVTRTIVTGITLTDIYEENIPMDWSIKKCIRIISPNSFSWTTNLSSLAVSSGISSFIRGKKVDTSKYMNPRGNTQQVRFTFAI